MLYSVLAKLSTIKPFIFKMKKKKKEEVTLIMARQSIKEVSKSDNLECL